MTIKERINSIPVVGYVARRLYIFWTSLFFQGSEDYWQKRYEQGGNSGDGSYNKFAQFKADFLNDFVVERAVTSVIEYGCGDGNQLVLAQYPKYLGFDISQHAIDICREKFKGDERKDFKLVGEYNAEKSELTLSLDVIYHLTEDDVFEAYIARLFDSSEKYAIIYSSNTDGSGGKTLSHVRHRCFSKWVEVNRPEWSLVKHVPNKYPFDEATHQGAFADFYVYERQRG